MSDTHIIAGFGAFWFLWGAAWQLAAHRQGLRETLRRELRYWWAYLIVGGGFDAVACVAAIVINHTPATSIAPVLPALLGMFMLFIGGATGIICPGPLRTMLTH